MQARSFLRTLWRWFRWPLLVLLVLYVALVIYRAFAINAEKETAAAVARIHAQKLTMDDIDGKHLPPPPDPQAADATLEGIDANANGIRDDVELAIFKKYPNDIKVRAAELQYAKALQFELSNVLDSPTLIATIQEEDRGYFCIAKSVPDSLFKSEIMSIESLVINTNQRKERHAEIHKKYMASYGDVEGPKCDLEI